jgi:pyrroline-5-carboxylate reductase
MKYGFIGCGNMGSALLKALCLSTKDIIVSDHLPEKAEALSREFNVKSGTNSDVVLNAERVFLAVKPQMLDIVLNSLKKEFDEKKPLIISMAAGVRIEKIQGILGENYPVIRIMPNTPVSVGKGLIMYDHKNVQENDVNDFVYDMRGAGILDKTEERLIDAGTAVSGCGPAYMYMFIEALADGGVAAGLPREKAILYAAATMEGAARLLLESGKHPGELKDAVCSPGGSTIMGVKALEENGLRSSAMLAVQKAYERNKELGK